MSRSDTILAGELATRLAAVCPKAPPGAQIHINSVEGYVLWGVIALFGITAFVGVGAIVAGRMFAMPHASKGGIITLVVVFFAAIGLMIVPGVIDGVTGSGCI